MPHDPMAGEFVFWDYLFVRFSDIAVTADKLAEHGRAAHKLHDQWRAEVKKNGTTGPPKGPVVKDRPKKADKGKKGADGDDRGGSDSDSSDGEAGKLEEESSVSDGAKRPTSAARPSFLAV